MKKKVFFLFAFFVGAYLMIAWHFATIELATLNKQEPLPVSNTEVVVEI